MRARFGLVLACLAGCGIPHVEKPWPAKPDTGRELPPSATGTTGDGAAKGLASKVVNAKEEPATLIAADRTSCTVSADRFREVIVGTKVWCAWR